MFNRVEPSLIDWSQTGRIQMRIVWMNDEYKKSTQDINDGNSFLVLITYEES